MSIDVTVVCDDCGAVLAGGGRSAAKARDDVRRMGGRVNLPGGRDLCRECASGGMLARTSAVDHASVRTLSRSMAPPGQNQCPSVMPGPPPAVGEYRCELGAGHRLKHCFAGMRWS